MNFRDARLVRRATRNATSLRVRQDRREFIKRRDDLRRFLRAIENQMRELLLSLNFEYFRLGSGLFSKLRGISAIACKI